MNRRTLKTVLLSVLILIGLSVLGVSFACVSTPEEIGLKEGALHPCPDSPNCVSSEDQLSPAWIEPLAFSGPPSDAFASLLLFLESESGVELVTIEPDYVHAVYQTSLLRFRDDVEFRLDESASVIHVRSASRVGHSDLGANRDRIESLRERWKFDAK